MDLNQSAAVGLQRALHDLAVKDQRIDEITVERDCFRNIVRAVLAARELTPEIEEAILVALEWSGG